MIWQRNPKKLTKPSYTEADLSTDKDYIESELIESIEDYKDNVNFRIDLIPVESKRVNRQDYINSFRQDVGILNILEKVRLSGDTTLLNRINRASLPVDKDNKEVIQDFTPITGVDSVHDIEDNSKVLWNSLPDALKNGRSYEDFLLSVTKDELDSFVNSFVGGKKDE